jgi:ElaB/YqjD/DUF883 family membrane-anchored ribosome-binding protein
MDDREIGSAGSPGQAKPAATGAHQSTSPSGAARLSKVGDVAQQAGSQLKEQAGALATQAGDKAKNLLGTQIEAGADYLEHIGRSATAAAESLQAQAPQLAGLVRDMATSVADLSQTMRGQSPEALLETASTYVRENPALVFGAAAVCGFAVTRLLQGGAWNGSRGNAPRGSIGASRSDAF